MEWRCGEVGITSGRVRLGVAKQRSYHGKAESARGADAREAVAEIVQSKIFKTSSLA